MCAVLLAWPASAAAQDEGPHPHFPDAGSWSIAATLPGGGGNLFGFYRTFGTRINVGFEVDYRNREATDEGTSAFVSPNTRTRDDLIIFGPSVRYYVSNSGPVAPYVRAAFGWQRRDIEVEQINSGNPLQNQQEEATIWRLAVGADWFPARNVAVGFFTGIVGLALDSDIELGSAGTITRKNDNFSTFKSGLELQLFFR